MRATPHDSISLDLLVSLTSNNTLYAIVGSFKAEFTHKFVPVLSSHASEKQELGGEDVSEVVKFIVVLLIH